MTNTKINHRGIQEYLDGRHGVDALLESQIQETLGRARSAAPEESGDYKRSLHVETVHTDRMVKRVVADVPYAMKVEANYGVLTRALGGRGGLVKYTSKSGKVSMITQAQADNYSRNRR